MEFTFKHQPMETRYELLKCMFRPTYRAYCRGHYKDDRRLFINVYRNTIRLLLVWDKVYGQSAAADVGIGNQFQEYKETMQRIQERFERFARERAMAGV